MAECFCRLPFSTGATRLPSSRVPSVATSWRLWRLGSRCSSRSFLKSLWPTSKLCLRTTDMPEDAAATGAEGADEEAELEEEHKGEEESEAASFSAD